jgi:hypothetical protein
VSSGVLFSKTVTRLEIFSALKRTLSLIQIMLVENLKENSRSRKGQAMCMFIMAAKLVNQQLLINGMGRDGPSGDWIQYDA